MNQITRYLKLQSQEYWSKQNASDVSMLGGYAEINDADIKQSKEFLLKNIKTFNTTLELGCGIGRVSDQLLKNYFKELHLVEREPKFINILKERLSSHNIMIFQQSVELFKPQQYYDCVWIQWICMYLSDNEICNMLNNFKQQPIILKENISTQSYEYDQKDGSISRSETVYENLIKQSGLKIINTEYQTGFADDFQKVKFYFLN